ncbi:MAG: hypothetical protein MI861_20310 [Pirellulales bacterium]|nr:hypothetical protein [Pirellulales bacterium]
MKRLTRKIGPGLAAALMVISATSLARGQGHEFIVDAKVVSDTATSPSDRSVGDIPAQAADGSAQAVGCQQCGEICSSRLTGSRGVNGNLWGGLRDRRWGNGSCGCVNRGYGQPDLFHNYYTQGNCNQANAQMYLSPLPVPPNVGHTFNTYQPFYPHELLYWHRNRFHNHYDNGRGLNRTRATYYSPPIRQAASNIYWNYLRIPR